MLEASPRSGRQAAAAPARAQLEGSRSPITRFSDGGKGCAAGIQDPVPRWALTRSKVQTETNLAFCPKSAPLRKAGGDPSGKGREGAAWKPLPGTFSGSRGGHFSFHSTTGRGGERGWGVPGALPREEGRNTSLLMVPPASRCCHSVTHKIKTPGQLQNLSALGSRPWAKVTCFHGN